MAKKSTVISKHSRAARRGEVDNFDSSEAKELASLPRLEKTDILNPLIRSSVKKNEQLLNRKIAKSGKNLEKLKPGDNLMQFKKKKQTHMISKTIRSKQDRFNNFDGKLGKKIENSLLKKKKVANLRKTGWDKINEIVKESLTNDIVAQMDSEKKTNEDAEEEIFNEMQMDEGEEIIPQSAKNPFELLSEE